ncbi:hypothetical protein KC330_g8638 [Hortaea werneckii]|nr:hypothetical protein KC330_g8638 [Hortaea werneckii]
MAPAEPILCADVVEATIDRIIAGTPNDDDLQVLEQASESATWRTFIHCLVPELRPEKYYDYNNENIYIVFLRLVLWTDHGLGVPKRAPPPRDFGLLSLFWRRIVRILLSRVQPGDAETEVLQRAIGSVSAAFALLDGAFYPGTGATVRLGRICEQLYKLVADGVAISHLNVDLFRTVLGHLMHELQQQSDTLHGVNFRSMVADAVEALNCLFETLRTLATGPEHDGAYQPPTLLAHGSHPSSSESNAQKHSPNTSAMFPLSLLLWAQNSSLVANSPLLYQFLSPTEGRWQIENEHQDIEGLLVSTNGGFDFIGPGHLRPSLQQDGRAYSDENGSVDEECGAIENEHEEYSKI